MGLGGSVPTMAKTAPKCVTRDEKLTFSRFQQKQCDNLNEQMCEIGW